MMFRVGAPGGCVEHVSSSLVSYLCLRLFQANGGGMKLSSEIARTKKNNFFFVSSMKTDKKKKQKSLRQKWLNAAELRNRLFFFLFFSPMQELSHRCSHRQRRTLFEFLETFCFHKNMSPIHFRGNWLVHVYHIALNKASEWKWS